MKLSIFPVLLALMVLPVILAVLLVASFSIGNGSQAVGDVVQKLRDQVSDRVYERISSYISTPYQINRLNLEAYKAGQLNLESQPNNNANSLDRYFSSQLIAFRKTDDLLDANRDLIDNTVNSIYVSNTQNLMFIGAERDYGDPKQTNILYTEKLNDPDNNVRLCAVRMNSDGERGEAQETDCGNDDSSEAAYEIQKRPWFTAIESSEDGQIVWTPVYEDASSGASVITAVTKEGDFAFASDVLIDEINEFLRSLKSNKISENGEIHILKRWQEAPANSENSTLVPIIKEKELGLLGRVLKPFGRVRSVQLH